MYVPRPSPQPVSLQELTYVAKNVLIAIEEALCMGRLLSHVKVSLGVDDKALANRLSWTPAN